MPWHVAQSSECPAARPWACIQDTNGQIMGCHPSKADAEKQMAALYANEKATLVAGPPRGDTMTVTDCGCETAHLWGTRADVDNSAWDGPAAMSRCASSETPASCYESICAGRKAGDAKLQSSWALPHHKTAGGPPNADGVRNSLSRLPQTDDLTNREAAQRHLEAHLRAIQGEGEDSAHGHHEHRAEHPPTERLLRVSPFAIRTGETLGPPSERSDGLTLDGYAAVFKRWTLIDSWEGRFHEQVLPGSMRKTFREQTPRLQFDHGTHPMIGSIPIGVIESVAEERDEVLAPDGGAHVVARLLDNWLTQPVRDAIAARAITGMSFRFSVLREDWHTPEGQQVTNRDELDEMLWNSWMEEWPPERLLRRSLREVRVPELGPVVYAAYEDTSVDVRGRVTIDLAAVRSGNPDESRKLASAVLFADAHAAREKMLTPGPAGDGILAVERSTAPESTGGEPAGVHPVEAHDAPEVTDTADNHPSSTDAETLARERAVRADRRARWVTFVHGVTASHPVDESEVTPWAPGSGSRFAATSGRTQR